MKLIRTEKQFTKENMPLDFLRRVLSLAGLHSIPLKLELENFTIEEKFRGESKTGHKNPWEDGDEEKGWIKTHYLTHIEHNTGFDTYAYIFTKTGKLQGYYKKSVNTQFAPDNLEWTILLLEYGFLKAE